MLPERLLVAVPWEVADHADAVRQSCVYSTAFYRAARSGVTPEFVATAADRVYCASPLERIADPDSWIR